jgi:integrase
MLREHKLASAFSAEDGVVFCSHAGTPIEPRNLVRRGLAPALRAAGLPRLRWHDLRHVAASSLIAAGLAADDVARILGHSSAAVTLRVYAHDFDARSRHERVRDSIDASYAGLL